MQVNDKMTNPFFSKNSKQKQGFVDEFQGNLNDFKKKEYKEKQLEFSNEDLNLGRIKENFITYAQQKMKQDIVKKGEENLINKLFTTIDAMNKRK